MVVSVRTHNGVDYIEHSQTPIDVVSTSTFDGKKIKRVGPASIVEMRKSWKYPHELHITVHCNPLQTVLEAANKSLYDRDEIAIPFNLGVQWLQRGTDSLFKSTGDSVSKVSKLHEIL